MGYFIRFNNNNIWEIVPSDDDYRIVCYKRDLGKRADSIEYKHVIDEENLTMNDKRNFNYLDWKSFYGEGRIRKLVADFSTEQTVLPLIYFVKYFLGFNDDSKMERERSTKWTFRK